MRIHKGEYFETEKTIPASMPSEIENPQILHKNRLTARSTVIPASEYGVYYYNKEKSDRIYSLNGKCRFALFDDYAPDNFEKSDYDDSDWDEVKIPSMWQYDGYGQPTYPNTEFPFPFDPPHIDRLNPVGCYIKKFNIKELSYRTILHFGGVDNAFYVYLNGEFIGFSKGSRIPSEFDISSAIKVGENKLAVKVYTYSDASYLENQDMLLASGIFRDVYLISVPKVALWDYEIITDMEKMTVRATLFEKSENATVIFRFDGEEKIIKVADLKAECVFLRKFRKLWNAEEPNLYDLTITVLDNNEVAECHSKRVGFVLSEVKNQGFYINGSKITIRGINRHENDSENGRYVTVEQIKRDLEVIKSANINAIRCSHYTNNPAFYELASEMGFYVMDEADLESHGCGITGDQGYINKIAAWNKAFLDRVKRMVACNKNETCIVIWSVGNENGEGENCDACIKYLNTLEDKKPAVGGKPSSFIICGYPDVSKMRKCLEENKNDDRPIMLIEYAHAMGNGPGSLESLWNFVLENPQYCGGYVWEFRSHGMKRNNKDGTVDYLYGGDFHDEGHWSNFTLDGFLTSDSTPKPTFYDLKYIYAPIGVKYKSEELIIENQFDFIDTSHLSFEAILSADGKACETVKLNVGGIEPHESAKFPIKHLYSGYDRFITVLVRSGNEIIKKSQFILEADINKSPLGDSVEKIDIISEHGKTVVSGQNFEVVFKNGLPCFYKKDDVIYIDKPVEFVTYRAEIDNDGIVGLFPRWISCWEDVHLHKMRFFERQTVISKKHNVARIDINGIITAEHCFSAFDISGQYLISHGGLLRVKYNVRPTGRMPRLPQSKISRLPRFGVCIPMNKSYNRVSWFGRGENQSYTDSTISAPVGMYDLPIEKMNFLYDVPQETGSRCDTRYVRVYNNDKHYLTVYGNDCFSFAYHPWKLDVLRNARHRSELKEDGCNYLYIDYRMRALGSMSCGPNPEPEFDFEPHDFVFTFAINGEQSGEPDFFLKDLGEKTRKLTEKYTYTEIVSKRNEVECDESIPE